VEPVLVGAERGVEADLLPSRPYRYHLLPAEPLYRRQVWRNARWPLLLPRLWRAARVVIEREAPSLVVGTGGYAAGPTLLAGWWGGLPLALQEQNAYPGLATRWTARWARQIHLGFPEAARHLRTGRRTEVFTLGNPIAPPLPVERGPARAALGLDRDAPVVLVAGGSQGARAINAAVAAALEAGRFAGVAILWSTGAGTYDQFRRLAADPWVQVRPFWDPMATAYAAADLVVARAGAMTIAELAAWGLPAVLVPLPGAAADHQTANAAALAAAGAAVHLPERTLSGSVLADTVGALLADGAQRAGMSAAARQRGRPGAAKAIAERLADLL
jgi:UDP-N-acetylglucosamine--N-acetylmuramyl-(pentapeptide) pyrophosphoryl-undecaprenol N-acetylglucosamine transferase